MLGLFCRLTDSLAPKMNFVGARESVHGAQLNGKQEGKANLADLTCAAPATVSRRVFICVKTPLSSQTTDGSETGRREGDAGRSASPDTGQQGDLSKVRLESPSTVGEGGEGAVLVVL